MGIQRSIIYRKSISFVISKNKWTEISKAWWEIIDANGKEHRIWILDIHFICKLSIYGNTNIAYETVIDDCKPWLESELIYSDFANSIGVEAADINRFNLQHDRHGHPSRVVVLLFQT